MGGLANVFDWEFYWGVFGFFLRTIAPFLMLIVAIISVGLLLKAVIGAIKTKGS